MPQKPIWISFFKADRVHVVEPSVLKDVKHRAPPIAQLRLTQTAGGTAAMRACGQPCQTRLVLMTRACYGDLPGVCSAVLVGRWPTFRGHWRNTGQFYTKAHSESFPLLRHTENNSVFTRLKFGGLNDQKKPNFSSAKFLMCLFACVSRWELKCSFQ